jgi:hypothetical protein
MEAETYVAGWRIWFDDGRVYQSSTDKWEELPDDGVLVRMLYFTDGTKQIQCGNDFYYEAPHPQGTIYGAANEAFWDPKRYPGAIVKRGRWAPDAYFKRIHDAAFDSVWGS